MSAIWVAGLLGSLVGTGWFYVLVIRRIEPETVLGCLVTGGVIALAYLGALASLVVGVYLGSGPHC